MLNAELYWETIDYARKSRSWDYLATRIGIAKTTILHQKKYNLPLTLEASAALAVELDIPLSKLGQVAFPSCISKFPIPSGATYTDYWWSVIDQLRKDFRMSWAKLGKHLDVSDRTLLASRNRGSNISFDLALRIMEIFEIDVDALDFVCRTSSCDVDLDISSIEEKLRRLTVSDRTTVVNLIDFLLEKMNPTGLSD